MPGLRAAFAPAGPTLSPVGFARAVGRRSLGQVVGVQADAALRAA